MSATILDDPLFRAWHQYFRGFRYRGYHDAQPKLIPMLHRYQCDDCKKFVYYDEGVGRWFHWAPRG